MLAGRCHAQKAGHRWHRDRGLVIGRRAEPDSDIGATCTLREDGMKEILQLQYSLHETSFSFMTQFGRFAKILNLDLSDYRIVQDSHFSLGGPGGPPFHSGQLRPWAQVPVPDAVGFQ